MSEVATSEMASAESEKPVETADDIKLPPFSGTVFIYFVCIRSHLLFSVPYVDHCLHLQTLQTMILTKIYRMKRKLITKINLVVSNELWNKPSSIPLITITSSSTLVLKLL